MYWKVSVLYYGKITLPKAAIMGGLDPDLMVDLPYMGFLLQKDGQNILVDNGINGRFIVDGKAWGGFPAEGGEKFVLEALAKAGLTPADIHMVIYTHLHNDHAGNCHLFPDALTIFQKDEWLNLLNPLPSQQLRGDYDPAATPHLQLLKNVSMVEGDIKLGNGLELYQIPGHTLGSLCVKVETAEGPRLITGDYVHFPCMIFPQTTEMVPKMGAAPVPITPVPEKNGPVYVHSLVYDHYAHYASYYKLKALVPTFEPKYFLCGHDISLFRAPYYEA